MMWWKGITWLATLTQPKAFDVYDVLFVVGALLVLIALVRFSLTLALMLAGVAMMAFAVKGALNKRTNQG